MKLLIATNNQGKLIEIKSLLEDLALELVTPGQIGLQLDVVEDGTTYADNARKKGIAFARESGLLSLADDSGLEVAALDGRPGLHSARFSPIAGATDADRRQHLLKQLRGHPRPWTAQFRCVVCLVSPAGDEFLVEGICPGEIIPQERGHNGFGYDPIFLLPELNHTMAELSMDEKNRLSHRARAVMAARPALLAYLQDAR